MAIFSLTIISHYVKIILIEYAHLWYTTIYQNYEIILTYKKSVLFNIKKESAGNNYETLYRN